MEFTSRLPGKENSWTGSRETGPVPAMRVFELRLPDDEGFHALVCAAGAALTELHVPDRAGRTADVVLGFADPAAYLEAHPCVGATVGRVAGRIAGAAFDLFGRHVDLPANSGPHHLHGDFHRRLWSGRELAGERPGVRFTLTSPHGDGGFPGNLDLEVTYSLGPGRALRIDYRATCDRPTPLNLTNHSYFNLSGVAKRTTIDRHELTLHASRRVVTDPDTIPTGELADVAGTPLDFRAPRAIGAGLHDPALRDCGGYDHTFLIDDWRADDPEPREAGLARDPLSGRVMRVLTTEPCIQLYTANGMDGSLVGRHGPMARHGSFCLECQHVPDSVHHAHFPSTILRPGEEYTQTTIYRFEVDG